MLRHILAGVVALAATNARAELKPAEVAIVAARGNPESEALARHYAQARGVPQENICLVDLPPGEVCPRGKWASAVRPAIRQWVAQHDGEGRLQCLVTVWGTPLRIGPSEPADLKEYRAYLAGERRERLDLLQQTVRAFDEIAAVSGTTGAATQKLPIQGPDGNAALNPASAAAAAIDKRAAAEQEPATDGAELTVLRLQLQQAALRAQQRLNQLPTGTRQFDGQARLMKLATVIGGQAIIAENISKQLESASKADAALAAERDRLRGVMPTWAAALALVEQRPPGIERDAVALTMLEQLGGQLAIIPWLDLQLEMVDKNETAASFDSELALVMWPDDYQLLRWQPNYLVAAFDHSHLRQAHRTLMVARLDGPTPAIAKGLVDAALAVEKAGGLKGKAYIDARGLVKLEGAAVEAGSFEDYDRALLVTAQGLKQQSGVETALNNGPDLFQPGQCPQAALYCGWYSLGKYIDAFDWQPGAVAYHLGSSEAGTLHDPKSEQWCKRLLEDGVAATLGAVDEPHLFAFPRPEEFFEQLTKGELTLAECYWRTVPFASWQMALIGDPLYRPFKPAK